MIRDINKYSNNVMAQQLFLTLGREGGEIHLNAKLVWRGKHEHIGMAKCLETVGHVRPLPPKAAKEEDRQEGVA